MLLYEKVYEDVLLTCLITEEHIFYISFSYSSVFSHRDNLHNGLKMELICCFTCSIHRMNQRDIP